MGRISPQEIREAEFKQSALGYSREQVNQFLEKVADEVEALTREYNEIYQENKEALQSLQTYANVEESLKATLVQAQETAQQFRSNAQNDADNILRKATTEKDALLFSAKEDLAAIQADIRQLKSQRDTMLVKLKSILTSNLEVLNEAYTEKELKEESLHEPAVIRDEQIVDFSKADMIVEDLPPAPEEIEEPDIIFNETEESKDE